MEVTNPNRCFNLLVLLSKLFIIMLFQLFLNSIMPNQALQKFSIVANF